MELAGDRGAGQRQGPIDSKAEREAWRHRLQGCREQVERDPHSNAIRLMADSLVADILGGRLDLEALDALVQELTTKAFASRANRIRSYLGGLDAAANQAIIEQNLRNLADDGKGGRIEFDRYKQLLERRHFGVVITAHPTFSLARALQQDLMTLVLEQNERGQDLDDELRRSLLERVARTQHKPEPRIDLDEEHRQSLTALVNLRHAMATIYGVIFDVVRDLYPEDWQGLTPSLVSIATWVGYDTDGRADISWAMTFSKRIITQVRQLQYYLERTEAMRARLDDRHVLASHLELIQARIALTQKALDDELHVFNSYRAGTPGAEAEVAQINRSMATHSSQRLTDARQLGQLVDRALDLADDEVSRRDLWVMRAEVASSGLTAARSHLRINAIQLHNAIRKEIGMDHAADDPSYQRSYVGQVATLIENAQPETINFGSLINERATAKRAMMIIRQMLTYLDGSEPVRFLIAECDSPLTLLVALYFAKQFGIDGRVDISPLFETSTAIERGTSILEGAIAVPAYRKYLEGRGRLCVQTGFSDAGRYIGQIAASHAIERIRIGLADLLVEQGLGHIELVIFDTHGESIGRGAHPASLIDRFRYYDTPYTRARFAKSGIAITEETSFQGGDGYTFFLRQESALAVTTRIVEHLFTGTEDEASDPYYDDNAYAPEFFAAIRLFNYRMIANPNYARFLGAFGLNLLYPTGSRSLKRQHDRGIANIDLEHPSQLRAIPHNSILQQLGILANTIGGVGQAVDRDPRRFQELYRVSSRFRRLMMMVEYAFMYTDLDVVRSYLSLFDNIGWLREAQREKSDSCEEELRLVASVVGEIDMFDRLNSVYSIFLSDYIELARALREHRRLTRNEGGDPIAIDEEARDNLHLLHALRIALIKALMRRSVHIPDFSDRHATTHDDLVANMMRLDVESALGVLHEVFPLTETSQSHDYGEPASYRVGNESYRQEHEEIFRPIANYYALIRRIGTGVVHHIGALG